MDWSGFLRSRLLGSILLALGLALAAVWHTGYLAVFRGLEFGDRHGAQSCVYRGSARLDLSAIFGADSIPEAR